MTNIKCVHVHLQVNDKSVRDRKEVSARLRRDLESNAESINYQMMYYTTEPKLTDHTGHAVASLTTEVNIFACTFCLTLKRNVYC